MPDDSKDIQYKLEEAIKLVQHLESQLETASQSKETKNFFKLSIDQLLEGMQIIDRNYCYAYINDVAAKHGKSTRQNLIGQKMVEMYPGIEETEFFKKLQEVMDKRMTYRMENHFVYPDKVTKCWFELLLEPHPLGVLIRSFDITDRKLLEEQYRHAQKMEVIGQMAGGIAHDFNNKLAIMMLYCELATKQLDAAADSKVEPLKKYIDSIMKAVKDSQTLTKQLLAFSRKQVLDLRVLDLNQVIMNMHDSLERLLGENIKLNLNLKEEIGTVQVDPSQMDQIILNLCINSRDAMPSGGVLTVETSMVELDEAYCQLRPDVRVGTYILLSISDNGAGMSDEIKHRIFEPFFTTKGVGKGTGLGLSSVHGIVNQCKGHIWVYSEMGVGTTFKLYFPLIKGEKEDLQILEPVTDVTGNENILLVENDHTLRAAFTEMLEQAGYKVIAATSAEEAEKIYLDNKQIDLLLTDVILAKINGKELSLRLKKYNELLRVIFISGYTENSIVHNGVLDDGFILLEKPVTSKKLLTTLRQVLDGKLVKGVIN